MTTVGLQAVELVPGPHPSERQKAWVATALLITVLVFWSRDPVPLTIESRTFQASVVAAAALATLRHMRRLPRPVPAGPVVSAGLVLLAFVGAVAVSPAWRTSLEAALLPLTALVLFLFAALGPVPPFRIHQSVVIAASVIGVLTLWRFSRSLLDWVAVIRVVAPGTGFWGQLPVTLPRTGFGFTHPNLLAMIFEVALPVASVKALTSRRRRWWMLGIVPIVLALFVTGSRGGLIAAGVGTATAVLLVGVSRKGARSVLRTTALAVGAGLMMVAGTLLVTDIRPSFLFRGTLGDRLPVMEAGWRMFLDRPWIGHGPGAFGWLADTYLGDVYQGSFPRLIWIHAHNGYVNLLLEVGVTGTLLIGAGLAVLVASLIPWGERARRLTPDSIMGFAVVLALAVHAFVDVGTETLSTMVFGALVLGSAARSHGPTINARVPAAVTVAAAIVVALPITIGLPAQIEYERGRLAIEEDDWAAAERYMGRAAALDPNPLYRRLRVRAALETEEWESVAETAVSAAEGAPTDTWAVLNAMRATGSESIAKSLATAADEVALAESGMQLLRLGNDAKAEQTLSRLLVINPWLVSAPMWEHIGVDIRSRVVDEVVRQEPCRVGEAFLLEEVIGPSALEGRCPVSSRAGLTADVLGNDPREALERLDSHLAVVPDDSVLRRLRGIALERLRGRGAGRFDLATAALLGDQPAARVLVATYPDGPPLMVGSLARSMAFDTSPVVPASSGSWYALAASRIETNHHRLRVPDLLPEGIWEGAIPGVHFDLADDFSRSGD